VSRPFCLRPPAALACAAFVFFAVPGQPATPGSPTPRAWDLSGNVRLAAGHKQNVLLSAVQPQDSGFALLEGEAFYAHAPAERLEVFAFATLAFTRFVDSAENPHEIEAFVHGEARWVASPRLQATGAVETYHLKQVFDLSVNNVDRRTALLAVTGGLVSTAVRLDLSRSTWLELKPAVQRERFRDHSDDHDQRLGRITIGHAFLKDRLQLTVSAQTLRRNYTNRPQYSIAGRPLVGKPLEFEQQEFEGRAKVTWGEKHRWSASAALIGGTNHDNGSGFFDYAHRLLRQDITWQHATWSARLLARAARYDYDVQTQGLGINPPFRVKEDYLAEARITRTWSARTSTYVSHIWERSRSNDPLARYRVQTSAVGVDLAL
jgi:hypothetical protein